MRFYKVVCQVPAWTRSSAILYSLLPPFCSHPSPPGCTERHAVLQERARGAGCPGAGGPGDKSTLSRLHASSEPWDAPRPGGVCRCEPGLQAEPGTGSPRVKQSHPHPSSHHCLRGGGPELERRTVWRGRRERSQQPPGFPEVVPGGLQKAVTKSHLDAPPRAPLHGTATTPAMKRKGKEAQPFFTA